MRVICVVQARLSSTRFNRKALADLNSKPLIWHVVNLATQIQGVDCVVLAVPVSDYDALEPAVNGLTLSMYGQSGPEDDVLGRFLPVARLWQADVVCRATGDCPVLDPVVAGQVLDLYHSSQPCDFASNDTLVSGYPDGWDVAVFSRAALETAAAQATDPADREHLECWMKRPENGLRVRTLMAQEPWTGPTKLSVDCEADLTVVKAWLAHG